MQPIAQIRKRMSRSGFTLIEMIAVLVLVSILSVTAIPSLARLDSARDSAMMAECERLIRLTQASAVSSGLPTGVRFDLDEQSVELISLDADGEIDVLVREGTGVATVVRLQDAFGISTIVEAGISGSTTDRGTAVLWFDYDGTPHTRNDEGANPVLLEDPFIIRSSSDRTVTVLSITGKVER